MELKQEQVVLLKQAIESQAGMWNSLQAIIGNNEIISKSQNELSKLGQILQAKDESLSEEENPAESTDSFYAYIEHVNLAPASNSKSEHTNFENEKDFSFDIKNPELSKEVLRFALVYAYFENLLFENFELEQFSDIERKIIVNFNAIERIISSFEYYTNADLFFSGAYKTRLKYIFPENKELTESLLAIVVDDQKISKMQRDLYADYGRHYCGNGSGCYFFMNHPTSKDRANLILDYKERHPNFYSLKSNYKELLEENHQLLLEYIESLKFLENRKDLYEELKKIDEIKDIKDMCKKEDKWSYEEIDEKKHKFLREIYCYFSIPKKTVLVETYSENYKEFIFKDGLEQMIKSREKLAKIRFENQAKAELTEKSSQSQVDRLKKNKSSSVLSLGAAL